METEKRKAFIINFMYFAIILIGSFLFLKYIMPMLTPFVIAFVIAYMLKGPIVFFAENFKLKRKVMAIIMVLIFYSTIGVIISLIGIKTFSELAQLIGSVPAVYTTQVEPMLMNVFDSIEKSIIGMDQSMIVALEEMSGQFIQSVGQLVSSASMSTMGAVSGIASSLPGLFIKILMMIIATFFIAGDYDKLTGFCMKQLGARAKDVFLQTKEYVVGTLFVCIRSYILIMSITFTELAIGLSIIGVDNGIMVAFMIAIFDILPVLGTGGIMIPWVILEALQGNYPLAIGLLIVYIVITIIRNILEPKIVGSQLGLHPIVTLASMFVGAQVFGVLGLFGFPIGLSLLRHLNDNGTIKVFK